jgi:hypothetical protein
MGEIKTRPTDVVAILMPGLFLLINIAASMCLWLYPLSSDSLERIVTYAANPALSFIGTAVFAVFGYLMGVVLRLLRTRLPDAYSARWTAYWWTSLKEELFLKEPFPYIGWMGEYCRRYLPGGALDFYREYWEDKQLSRENTAFFNLCKVIVSKVDQASAAEINASEAQCRFISGSFYALLVALVLTIANFLVSLFISTSLTLIIVLIFVGYVAMLIGILSQFRFLRCREVGILFAACVANRQAFDELFPDPSQRRTAVAPAVQGQAVGAGELAGLVAVAAEGEEQAADGG